MSSRSAGLADGTRRRTKEPMPSSPVSPATSSPTSEQRRCDELCRQRLVSLRPRRGRAEPLGFRGARDRPSRLAPLSWRSFHESVRRTQSTFCEGARTMWKPPG